MPLMRRKWREGGKLIRLVCGMGMLVFLTGCGREPLYQFQSYVFGTLVEISFYGEPEPRARALAAMVQQEFQRLHQSLHAWQPSDLSRINAALARGESATVSAEQAALLIEATRLSEQSGGLFNPAIGHLIASWGFQRDEFGPVKPDAATLRKWVRANPRMRDLVIAQGRVSSRNPAVRLDLGGYAKGYALDRARQLLQAQQVQGALVNIGGNIIAIGKRGQRPWRVGIQHPRRPGTLATLELPDGWAIGTSGDYQRYFELDGKRYCHIIDPRTGYPAEGVQAVTVLVPPGPQAGTLSDVASKPLFISGPEGWRDAARRMAITHALLVDAAGNLHVTAAMQRQLHWTEPHGAVEIVP